LDASPRLAKALSAKARLFLALHFRQERAAPHRKAMTSSMFPPPDDSMLDDGSIDVMWLLKSLGPNGNGPAPMHEEPNLLYSQTSCSSALRCLSERPRRRS